METAAHEMNGLTPTDARNIRLVATLAGARFTAIDEGSRLVEGLDDQIDMNAGEVQELEAQIRAYNDNTEHCVTRRGQVEAVLSAFQA